MMRKVVYTLVCAVIFVSCFNDSDDDLIAQCATPTNVQFSNTGITSADVTWDDSNPSATYSLEYGESGFVPGTGTTIESDDPMASLTGLDAGTTYDVYVTALCPDTESMPTGAVSFTTEPPLVNPQFLTNLSDINLFQGDLEDLTPSSRAYEYTLATPLFTDYAYKQRLIALPPGTTLEYVDNGFPIFPDNTVISKTFYYNLDDGDPSLGKKIIETRLLIKQSGNWVLGNYKWTDAQTEAVLDDESHVVPVSFVNTAGETLDIDYVIPSAADCVTCHNNNSIVTPIGPRLRTLNINNQLQEMVIIMRNFQKALQLN